MMVHLLERAASELKCPDFGIRLASAQNGAKVLGPIQVVMANSNTLGDAYRYCAAHLKAYSSAVQSVSKGIRRIGEVSCASKYC